MQHWDVYADLERALTSEEQRAVFAAVDDLVPDSGCVGPNRGGTSEVYFVVSAGSEAEARAAAARYMNAVIQKAAVTVGFALELGRHT